MILITDWDKVESKGKRKKERKEKGEGGGNREEPEKVSARETL